MNRASLESELRRIGVRPDAYALDGRTPDEAYVLEHRDPHWFVYYSERGIRTGLRAFDSEAQACEYLYEMVQRDPATRA